MVQEVRPACSQVDLDGDENAAATATAADVMTRDDSDAEDSAEATDESSQDDMVEGEQPYLGPYPPIILPPILRFLVSNVSNNGLHPRASPHCSHPSRSANMFTPEARRTVCLALCGCASAHGACEGISVAPDAGTEDEGRPVETAAPAAEAEAPGGGALPNGSGQSPPRQEYRGPTAGCTAVGHCPLNS